MKNKYNLLVLLFALIFSFGAINRNHIVFAQVTEPVYMLVEYMKISSGQEAQYLELEQAWKKLHQERVASGTITGWNLYNVRFPEGTDREYDYVTVTTFGSLDNVEIPYPDNVLESVMVNGKLPEIYEKTDQIRSLVNGELWRQIEAVQPETLPSTPSKFVLLDVMKVAPGMGDDYLRMERELFRPIHEERMKEGLINGWIVYSLVLPGGTDIGYNYATVNLFDRLSGVENSYPEDVIKRALPDQEMSTLMQEAIKTRETVRTELWELVDHTE